MDKKQFKRIFDKCMEVDYVYCHYMDGYTGKVEATKHPEPAKIIIRNFHQDSGFDDYGVHYMEIPDKEFDDFEKAWAYFQKVSCYRVMDVGGSIYAENLEEDYIADEVKIDEDINETLVSEEQEYLEQQNTSDEVLEVTEEVQGTYMSRKGLTYEAIGSNPKDWQPAEIKGYTFVEGKGDQPIYHLGSFCKKTKVIGIGKSKQTITTIEYINDESEYTHQETEHKDDMMTMKCRLCGHSIKNQHFIINYKEKKYMCVGSECVGNHYGKVVKKAIKVFKDNKIRQDFKELRPKCIEFLSKQYDTSSEWAIKNKRIVYWAYKLRGELEKIEPEKTGSRKLKNRIKKMNQIMVGETQ